MSRGQPYGINRLFIDTAVRKGLPLPSGTVITVVQYNTQLDAEGNPVKDPNGRFIR
jgi:hypothetical protein